MEEVNTESFECEKDAQTIQFQSIRRRAGTGITSTGMEGKQVIRKFEGNAKIVNAELLNLTCVLLSVSLEICSMQSRAMWTAGHPNAEWGQGPLEPSIGPLAVFGYDGHNLLGLPNTWVFNY